MGILIALVYQRKFRSSSLFEPRPPKDENLILCFGKWSRRALPCPVCTLNTQGLCYIGLEKTLFGWREVAHYRMWYPLEEFDDRHGLPKDEIERRYS